MRIISNLYNTIIEALFPLSSVEKEVISLTPTEAYASLPRAPAFDDSVLPLPNTRSIFAYRDERVAKLVWNIKYKKLASSVTIGGYALYRELLAENKFANLSLALLRQDFGGQAVSARTDIHILGSKRNNNEQMIIVPMPITKKRRNERGYNQCELLVDEIERLDRENSSDKLTGQIGRFSIVKDLLIRSHHASRQTLKDRAERLESARGIFDINKDSKIEKLKNSKIIIIDDVITTGSTMKEALDTLKSAGFENVSGLSLAH